MLTNGDNILHPTLPELLRETMKRLPAVCSFRLNCKEFPDLSLSPKQLAQQFKPDFGRDLFAFRYQWLREHFAEIPDMFLGEWEWDLILALMIRKYNGVAVTKKSELQYIDPRSELPLGYVLHEEHQRPWLRHDALRDPAKWHNQRAAKDWYYKNNLGHLYTLV